MISVPSGLFFARFDIKVPLRHNTVIKLTRANGFHSIRSLQGRWILVAITTVSVLLAGLRVICWWGRGGRLSAGI